MRFLKIAFIAVIAGLASCNNQPSRTTARTATAPAARQAPVTSLGAQNTNNLTSMLSSYYELKDALVATDAQKADIAASHVLSAAETMRHELGDARPDIRASLDSVMRLSEGIVNEKDESCDKKRIIFNKVSDFVFGIARAADLKHGQVYLQHCPMALGEKGANWLSNVDEIRNPYLPKTMLECGEVQDSL